jgi:TOMM system kinase/cyclase fusion protein
MTLAQPSPPVVGGVFHERYRVVSELGSGGFGVVYKAVQLTTGQEVAIKVLGAFGARDAAAHERRAARLAREMRLCAQLHHPNIVGIIDFGEAEGGLVYLVFQFVPGRNLERLIAEEGPLEPQEAKHLMSEVLDALACAHAQGVIHRDLKPSNIMVVATGARRNALVLDFGIGVLTDVTAQGDAAKLTASNELLGTIAYAAPEQLLRRAPAASSDLYSWGLVFLECLTGRPAIEGASLVEILMKQVSVDPVPVPASLADHALGRLLRRVTAKDAKERDLTSEQVLRELEACDVGGLGRASPARAPEQGVAHAVTMQVAWAPSGVEPASSDPRIASPRSLSGVPSPLGVELGPGSLQSERRQVTVVSCTFSATPAGEGALDLEELDELLQHQRRICAESALRFHGHVAGVLADQALLYFGYPAADEDAARRAARAALAMVAEIERQNPQIEAERGARLGIRIGIHTGLVVAGGLEDAGRAIGTTPKIAARIGGAAQPGVVAVSGDAHRLLRGRFAFEDGGIRYIEEIARPIEVFRLLEPLPAPSAVHSRAPRSGGVPLLGRDPEIAGVVQRFRQAGGGNGQVVLVSGEAGIGKSRLVHELALRVRSEPHRWLECRCVPEGQNSALHPFIELIERLLEPSSEATPEAKTRKLGALLHDLEFTLDGALPIFCALLGYPLPEGQRPLDVAPPRQKERTLHAILSLLFELSEREPVVVVMEDLHWADPTTLELLGQLVKEVPSARVLAVLTARPEFSPAWATAGVAPVQLGRLTRAESEELIARTAEGRDLPRAVLDRVAERTDGVPLFIEELTRTVVESGVLSQPGRGAEIAGAPEIPATLRDSLAARLDRLGRAKETAQLAAAIGREFTFELISAVSSLDPVSLQEDLDRLVGAELLARRRRIRNPAYTFKHALVRDAAYESMLRRTRVRVHATIARALEERFPEIVATRPELLALHAAAADQRAAAIGYALKAAGAALQSSANVEAIGHARQAMSWLEGLDPGAQRAEMELGITSVLTTALMATRGPGSAEARAVIVRSQALLDELGDNPHALPTMGRLVAFHQMRGDVRESLALGERYRALAERADDAGQQVLALNLLGRSLVIMGRFGEARAHLERALSLYDPEAHRHYAFTGYGMDLQVDTRCTLSLGLWLQGYADQSLACIEEARAWAERLSHANSFAITLVTSAVIHHYRMERDRVAEQAGRLDQLCQRHGLYLGMFAGLLFGWYAREPEGPKQILGGLRAFGQLHTVPYWSSTVAESEAALGQFDQALARIDECSREAQEMGELYFGPEFLRLKGAFLLQQSPDAEDRALACFEEAIALAGGIGAQILELRAAVARGEILSRRGRGAEARASIEAAYGRFTEGFETPDLVRARELLASLGG